MQLIHILALVAAVTGAALEARIPESNGLVSDSYIPCCEEIHISCVKKSLPTSILTSTFPPFLQEQYDARSFPAGVEAAQVAARAEIEGTLLPVKRAGKEKGAAAAAKATATGKGGAKAAAKAAKATATGAKGAAGAGAKAAKATATGKGGAKAKATAAAGAAGAGAKAAKGTATGKAKAAKATGAAGVAGAGAAAARLF